MCSNKESPLFSISSSQFFKTKHLKNAFTSIPIKLHPARDLFLILSYVHPEYISVQYISNKASCLKTIKMSIKILFFFYFFLAAGTPVHFIISDANKSADVTLQCLTHNLLPYASEWVSTATTRVPWLPFDHLSPS